MRTGNTCRDIYLLTGIKYYSAAVNNQKYVSCISEPTTINYAVQIILTIWQAKEGC